MQTTKVVINGAKGRMGRTLLACAASHPCIEVVGATDLGDDIASPLADADCLVDFSLAEATPGVLAACLAAGKRLVMGTTGQDAATRESIVAASEKIPVVFAPNFSVGVNTLFWLCRKAAETLGDTFDIEVVEMHHRLKKDAPSGTAQRLGEILAEARALAYSEAVRHGREGMTGERARDEIGMHSMRGGDVVGDHTVVFAAAGERVELTHKASSRETFANGALRAAAWLSGRPPGLYDMLDVLGLPKR